MVREKRQFENLYGNTKKRPLTWTYEAVEGSIDVGQLHAAIPAIESDGLWNFYETL